MDISQWMFPLESREPDLVCRVSIHVRDWESGTLSIAHTEYVNHVVERFNISRPVLTPASVSRRTRQVNGRHSAGVSCHQSVGTLMWPTNDNPLGNTDSVRTVSHVHDYTRESAEGVTDLRVP